MALSQLFTTYVRHLSAWTELLRVWHREIANYYNLKPHGEVTSHVLSYRVTQCSYEVRFVCC
jgi:hypothetical protein